MLASAVIRTNGCFPAIHRLSYSHETYVLRVAVYLFFQWTHYVQTERKLFSVGYTALSPEYRNIIYVFLKCYHKYSIDIANRCVFTLCDYIPYSCLFGKTFCFIQTNLINHWLFVVYRCCCLHPGMLSWLAFSIFCFLRFFKGGNSQKILPSPIRVVFNGPRALISWTKN